MTIIALVVVEDLVYVFLWRSIKLTCKKGNELFNAPKGWENELVVVVTPSMIK